MKKLVVAGGALVLAAVAGGAVIRSQSAEPIAAPSPPTTIAPAMAGAATGPAGLYAAKCGMCHASGPLPGYLALKQLGQTQPDLAKRTDLDPEYVKTVVRNGLAQMPPLTPSYVDDRELDVIARYLAGRK